MMAYTPHVSSAHSGRHKEHHPVRPPVDTRAPTQASQANPSFPLTPHNNSQWCKKIRGKIYFSGIWEEPEAALGNCLRMAADLQAGREPRTSTLSAEGLTVKHLCNRHLTLSAPEVPGGREANLRPWGYDRAWPVLCFPAPCTFQVGATGVCSDRCFRLTSMRCLTHKRNQWNWRNGGAGRHEVCRRPAVTSPVRLPG